jgi:hypothetical protein
MSPVGSPTLVLTDGGAATYSTIANASGTTNVTLAGWGQQYYGGDGAFAHRLGRRIKCHFGQWQPYRAMAPITVNNANAQIAVVAPQPTRLRSSSPDGTRRSPR